MSKLRQRNPSASPGVLKEDSGPTFVTSPTLAGEKPRAFDRVDPALIGKYSHIPLSHEYLKKMGPLPWNYSHIKPLTIWDWLLSPFLLATLVVKIPIGVFLFFWVVGGTWLLGLGCDANNRMKGWRKNAHNFVVRTGMRTFLATMNWIVIEEVGEKAYQIDGAPPIIVANHGSWADPVVLLWAYACPSFIAREVTRHIPFIGGRTEQIGCVFVSRTESNKEANVQVMKQINKFVGEWPSARTPLVIFPEGTTTNSKVMLEFKLGAFTAGAPVQPVLLTYEPGHFINMEQGHVAWIVFTLLGTLSRHKIKIEYLPVYRPSKEEKANPRLYADNVRKLMAAKRGVPMIDGMAVRERYLWFDHTYYRTTSTEEYLAKRNEVRAARNGGKNITLTFPDGSQELLE